MKKIRSRFSRVIGMAAAVSLLLCGNSAMAAFDVSNANGYDRLVAETDFEGYAKETDLPSAGGTLFEHKGSSSKYPPKAVTGPADAVGAEKHTMTARLDAVPDGSSDNYIRLRYQVIDPLYNSSQNPSGDFAKKHQLVKLEEDILWTSTDITGEVNYIDYDCENVQGHGTRAGAKLIKFANGTITVPYDTTNEPNARTVTYEANRWYHLTFYVNSATGRFSFYLDDQLVAENVRCFPDGKPGVMPLGFTTYINKKAVGTAENVQSIYLDNIRYRTLPMEERSYTVKRTAFDVDFDTKTFQPYTDKNKDAINKKGDSTIAVSNVDAASHGNVLRLSAAQNNKLTDAFVRPSVGVLTGDYSDIWGNKRISDPEKLAEMSKVHVSMDLCFNKYATGTLLYLYVKDSGDPIRDIGNLATFRNDGRIIFNTVNKNTPSQIVCYAPNQWYTFDLYFDLISETYTAKINGDTVVENIAMPNDPNTVLYLGSVYFAFAGWECELDGSVDIDNYKIDMVESTATPRLNRVQFKEDGSYLAYAADTSADMIYARYNNDGKVLENCEISQGGTGDLRIMEIDGGEGANERLFWWQSDTLTPVDGLPSLPALPIR